MHEGLCSSISVLVSQPQPTAQGRKCVYPQFQVKK